MDRVRVRRRAARAGARRSCPPPRSAPLPLEERQMGARPAAPGPRRARLLGVARLPPARRPLEGGAALGRLSWIVGEVVEAMPETPRVRTIKIQAPGWGGHRAGQHVDVRLTA